MYLFLFLLISRPQGRGQIQLAEMLPRSAGVLKLEDDVLWVAEIELDEIHLGGSHEVILKPPVIVEDLER